MSKLFISLVCLSTIIHEAHACNVDVTIDQGSTTTICATAATNSISASAGYTSYVWSGPVVGNGQTATPTGSGTITVSATDNLGCVSTASITVDYVSFKVEMLGSQTVCQGSSAILQASGGDVYAWSTNEFTPTIVVAPLANTTYSVTIYKGACHETLSIPVTIANLSAHSMPDTVYVFPGEPAFVAGPSNFNIYQWSPADVLTSTNQSSTSFVGSTSTDVTLIATNTSIGCSMTHTVHFMILDLTIPEGFSPNGDGINDFFEIPEIATYKNASLKVWNRWGDIVFESDTYRNEWDGTCQGPICAGSGTLPDGTYYYVLTVEGFKYEKFITLKK